MARFNEELDFWMNQLLDTSKRNPLINFQKGAKTRSREKSQKASHLFFPGISVDELYSSLSSKEKIRFIQGAKCLLEQNNGKTYLSLNNTQLLSLDQIFQLDHELMETQGIESLYLVLGFLHWNDSPKSELVSPLYLLPVRLAYTMGRASKYMVLKDQPILLNPTLNFYLEQEKHVVLPGFDENLSLEENFTRLQERIESYGWSIDREACLACFTYTKMPVFQDLSVRKEQILEHPILQKMALREPLITDLSPIEEKTETFEILESDESQIKALKLADQGISFVLKGPPGTGKSQTITNIIAQKLARDQKVLFVSEKRAALDIVYDRLKQAGLGEFVLVLHRSTTRKRDFVEQFRQVLHLPEEREDEENYQLIHDLKQLAAQLDAYASEINEPAGALQRSVYDVLGELAFLQAPEMKTLFHDLSRLDKAQYRQWISDVTQYDQLTQDLEIPYFDNPWRDFSEDHLSRMAQNRLEQQLADALKVSRSFQEKINQLNELDSIRFPQTPEKIPEGITFFKELSALKPSSLSTEKRALLLGRLALIHDKKEELERELAAKSIPADLTNAQKLLSNKERELDNELKSMVPRLQDVQSVQSLLQSALPLVSKQEELESRISRDVLEVLDDMDLEDILTRSLFFEQKGLYAQNLHQYLDDVSRLVSLSRKKQEQNQEQLLLEMLADVKEYQALSRKLEKQGLKEYERIEKDLGEVFHPGFFALEPEALIESLSITGIKSLNARYRRTRRTLSDLTKGNAELDDSVILSHLKALQTYKQLAKKLDLSLKEKMENLKEKILASYDQSVLYENLDELLPRFEKDYTGLLQGQVQAFLDDLDQLQSLLNRQIGPEEIRLLIEDIQQWRKTERDLAQLQTSPLLEDFSLQSSKQIKEELERLEKRQKTEKERKSIQSILEGLTALQAMQANLKKDYPDLAMHELVSQADEAAKTEAFITRWKEFLPEGLTVRSDNSLKDIVARAHTLSFDANELEKDWKEFDESYRWFASLFEHESFARCSLKDLLERMEACFNNMEALEEYFEYQKLIASLPEDLQAFLEEAHYLKLKGKDLLAAFKFNLLSQWVEAVLEDLPALSGFSGRMMQRKVRDYSGRDKDYYRVNQQRLKARLLAQKPQSSDLSNGDDEMKILLEEIEKRKNFKPFYQLFHEIPHLIQQLKPVIMMSPIDVSQYLAGADFHFDVVIFDEASQIPMEDALAAISRAKQVIVCGDKKQLPPTSFFQSVPDDEYDESKDLISVLDYADVLPSLTLAWHYRSRSEDLITFSNVRIYQSSIKTFPSNLQMADLGVEYIPISNGFYDRGGNRGNVNEAERVVDLIWEHIQEHPERSLGVITLGETQQKAIEKALNTRSYQIPALREWITKEGDEPFFIRNLESVQGNERDTIILSIGYGKDIYDRLTMNFGPISRYGGERRLNVAITRARTNLKVVSSIEPEEILEERITTEGPILLKNFLQFAKKGKMAISSHLHQLSLGRNSFEKSISRFLQEHGYDVEELIGNSMYRIDLAVVDPRNRKHYLLAIEADGRSFQQEKVTRDRERLRKEVLQGLGWDVVHLYAMDWYRNPERAGKELLHLIKEKMEQ